MSTTIDALAGHWTLEVYQDEVASRRAENAGGSEDVKAWATGSELPDPGAWVPQSGLSVTITGEDFHEYFSGLPEVAWVSRPASIVGRGRPPEIFDGRLVADGPVAYLVPVFDAWFDPAAPDTSHDTDSVGRTSLAGAELRLLEDGTLLRTVSVTVQGKRLTRLRYRYRRTQQPMPEWLPLVLSAPPRTTDLAELTLPGELHRRLRDEHAQLVAADRMREKVMVTTWMTIFGQEGTSPQHQQHSAAVSPGEDALNWRPVQLRDAGPCDPEDASLPSLREVSEFLLRSPIREHGVENGELPIVGHIIYDPARQDFRAFTYPGRAAWGCRAPGFSIHRGDPFGTLTRALSSSPGYGTGDEIGRFATFAGVWELNAYAEAPSLVEGQDPGVSELARLWQSARFIAPEAPWTPVAATVLAIEEDGTFREWVSERRPLPWWDAEGVRHGTATPFDGYLFPVTIDGVKPLPEDERLRRSASLHGSGDTLVGEALVREADGTLTRMVSVNSEAGYSLHRIWYRYHRIAEGQPAPSEAPRVEDSPFPSLWNAQRVILTAESTELAVQNYRGSLDKDRAMREQELAAQDAAPMVPGAVPGSAGIGETMSTYVIPEERRAGTSMHSRFLLPEGTRLNRGRGPNRFRSRHGLHDAAEDFAELFAGRGVRNGAGQEMISTLAVCDPVEGTLKVIVFFGESAWGMASHEHRAELRTELARELLAMSPAQFEARFPLAHETPVHAIPRTE